MENKQRLIDAYTFAEEIESLQITVAGKPARWNDAKHSVLRKIAEQPTVDAVVLPCKIGDTVWAIRNYRGTKHPQQGRVSEMFFTTEMKLHIVVSHISRGEWGKTIFATREEAEAALAERKI